ncbi:DNA-binding protein [Mycobacterium sp. 2-64]|uniref:helix-turn-helix transcriptional regulator n=1 Tax=Mycobacterium sp. 2-64 TaxID=3042319 RepID=UPI002DDB70C5|nr:DNA-binding protein [Mycobacterium sp. 2-64]WSE52714.1 DNA-binding protein [Mycobacterium sp. 2-64]
MSDTATAAPEYIDEGQTAAKIGSTRAALRQARYRGTGLPFVRIGRRIRYRVVDLEAYLADRTFAAGSSPPQQD